MTGKIDEQLSALLDGELPVEQEKLLLKRLAKDADTRDTLGRYGLIGDLIRDTAVMPAAMTISDRVAQALADEDHDTETQNGGSHPMSPSRTGFVGAGIAAAIAAVVVLNLASVSGASRGEGDLQVVPVASVAVTHHNANHVHPESPNSARLTRYLVAHAQFSNIASRQLVDSHLAMPVVSDLSRQQ
ncbi:MAG: sigma-E factor negative regulatory protein [Gammaproteobacteria bacterium]|nr:sigma-E factor negative regulatory protein [Gammaproteobacteria bacterium]